MIKRMKTEEGVVIVEATIIFPIVFLIVFLMIFLGNAYFQKSRVEEIVTKMTYYGSAQCADPLLKYVQENNAVPAYGLEYEIEPYRFLIGGMESIVEDVDSQIRNKVRGIDTGFFKNMEPRIQTLDAKFNNAYVYSTFSVEVNYKIPIPMRLPGMRKNFELTIRSRCDVPVSDTAEFIRNVDMAEDLVEATETGQNIIQKTNDIMNKIGEFIN